VTDNRLRTALTLTIALALTPGGAAAAPLTWKLVREVAVPQGTMVVAHLDDDHALATGCPAPTNRSVDGGKTWSPGYSRDMCRYGMDIVPGLVVNSGGGTIISSRDGGIHFERTASFGEAVPHHGRSLSFLDATRGVIATDEELGLTNDGTRTWQRLLPPEEAAPVAAVSMSEESGRVVLRVLDEEGALWRSDDEGRNWVKAPTPLTRHVRRAERGPMAALRFVGAEGVLAATLDDGDAMVGHVYRTTDGGKTWVEEPVSRPFQAATLTISRDGKILSALDIAGMTVKVYRAE
jgi:photosystem II stability/assembly factor-like uncharacterized protein